MINRILSAVLILMLSGGNISSQIRFGLGSTYRYLRGSEAGGLDPGWMDPGYNDSAWASGPAPFWYGDGSGGTFLGDMQGNYSTLYLRSTFTALNVRQLETLVFSLDYDDGFVLWVNGEEALRQNAPQEISPDAFALANHESGSAENFYLDAGEVSLAEDTNILAIQMFNVTLSSSDIHFDLQITADPELPALDTGAGELQFSHEAGFYDLAFDLILAASDSSLGILYTLDGSDPRTSTSVYSADTAVKILIDPDRTEGRPATPGVLVRASLSKEGYAPTVPETRTYLFVDRVRDQVWPGAPWPSSNLNGQVMDYDMDPEIVNDPRYAGLIEEALLDIPSLSLVSDPENLFNPAYGIYVNSDNYGIAWERDCSLELIDPQGEGFQVNGGMRIRGGASRGPGNPKHSFRLFFREEYGDRKLEFPLFGAEGTDVFDNVDIRTEQNYGWNRDGDPYGAHNTFVRDIYARRMQGEMGRPYTRSRYYHLYLNGMYWGLFMTEERPEASFAESYFGDAKTDYDVVKVTTQTWPYFNIVTDGNMDAWREVWNMCRAGFTSRSSYFKLEGRDPFGNPMKDSKVLVDVDNLIDYMIMIFFTGSFDAPVSAWGGEVMPNNYFAIYNRKNLGTGFVFVAHDMEHSLFVDRVGPGEGLYENRVTIPEMYAAGLLQFQPQWLHHKLCSNEEYRLRFSDRAYRFLGQGGLFTEDTAGVKFMEFADLIDMAIIAESARWGDARVSDPRTRDDDWLPAVRQVTDVYFPARTEIVIDQLLEADLYTRLNPPEILINGEIARDPVRYFDQGISLRIHNRNGSGEIVYTTDGNDPRMVGGDPHPGAGTASAEVPFDIQQTTIIKARILDGNQWSALVRIVLARNQEDFNGLKVTELHYHPPMLLIDEDTIPDTDLEFIELKNTGTHSLDISGLIFDSAVSFTVPWETFLAPGQFFVLASKPEYFYQVYGINPSGNYQGHFSNAGEFVLIQDREGRELISFTFDDVYPWPLLPDGAGYSLNSVDPDPEGDPNLYSYWTSSTLPGGTPFSNDRSVYSGPWEEGYPGILYRMFPNPARDYFNINCNGRTRTKVLIYNNAGNLVYRSEFSAAITIPCREVGMPGVYFVRLINGNSVLTEKICIVR